MALGRVVLVTGAGSGIGRASALDFASRGDAVALISRSPDEITETARLIEEKGGKALPLVADISEEAGMRRAVERVVADFGGLDVVVANAGINGVWAPIDELKPDEWDRTIAVNLRGTYLTLHLTIPHLRRAEAPAIVVVTSINGTRTFTSAGATAYSATKAAQLALVQQLALELGRDRIRINAVCPGAIETRIEDNTDRRNTGKSGIPVVWPEGEIPLTGGVPGTAEDVAEAITFLCSAAARHITGTPVFIDGGQSLLR
ncbi:SDR family oxidoreductase [Ensifer soli]|uniref:SDR family oxidoreductase n=1 Tax=Ciceribacter sp. sgz301302 TaxID=3342379 RepID=UPI0035B72ECF